MSESLYGTQPGDFSEAEPDMALVIALDAALAKARLYERLYNTAQESLYRAYRGWEDATMRLLAVDDTCEPATDVERVIEQLDRRIIGAPERTKLRGALDRADAPDKSRNGQDAAVGRALRLG